MYSISISLAIFPLTNIRISSRTSPNARTIFHSILPLSLISFSIFPRICPISFRLSFYIRSWINSAICELLISFSVLKIIIPFTFIDTSICINHYS
jgi:hypothetical protein